jgi:hypothetical protein
MSLGGHLETLRFLLDTHGGQAVFGDVVLDVTAEQLELDEWAPYKGLLMRDNAVLSLMDNAAYGGNVAMLKWLREDCDMQFTPITMEVAAYNGQLRAAGAP